MSTPLSKDRQLQLQNNLKRVLVLIVDERSMLSSQLLGKCERNIRDTIYGGSCKDHEFGGIPVVILIGDDFQFPPVVFKGKGAGAFKVYDKSSRSNSMSADEHSGIKLFQRLTENVFALTVCTRQKMIHHFLIFLMIWKVGNHVMVQ